MTTRNYSRDYSRNYRLKTDPCHGSRGLSQPERVATSSTLGRRV